MRDKKELAERIEKLECELATVSNPDKKAQICCLLSDLSKEKSADKAIEYAKTGIKCAMETDSPILLAKNYTALGIALCLKSYYTEALEAYGKMFEIAKQLDEQDYIARYYNNIGIVYSQTGDHGKAADAFHNALKINEKSGNRQLIAANINNLADIYQQQEAYEKAIEYYEKSIEIKEGIGDPNGLATSFNGLAGIYKHLDEIEKAEENYLKALDLFEQAGNHGGKATVLANIGTLKKLRKDFEGAKVAMLKALDIMKQTGNTWGVSASLINLATLELERGQFQGARDLAEEGLNIAKEIGAQSIAKSAYSTLSHAHEKMGNFQEALEYFKLHKEISDHIFDLNKTRQIERLETKYILEKNEREKEAYRKASITDTLTGLLNRPGIMEQIDYSELKREKEGCIFSIIICDIDHFKQFNDKYGHACGDKILRAVSNLLKEGIGEQGIIGRWGGEEFLAILPGIDSIIASEIAEKTRILIARSYPEYKGNPHTVTVSFGVAGVKHKMTAEECILQADKALYRAKEMGRNRVETT